jgi:O-antigen/teichoic acid export membrane protein
MKDSIKNITLVSITNLINLGLGLILFLAAATKLSIEDFGIYGLLTLLLVSMSKIIDFGSNSNFVAEFISRSKSYLDELISFKIIAFFISSFLSIIILLLVNQIYNFEILISFIFGLFFYGINYTLFALFQKDEEFVKASLLNFFPGLIKALFGMLIFLNLISVNTNQVFMIFSFSMIGSSIFLIYKYKELRKFKFKLNITHFIKNFYLAGIGQTINESWGTISNQILKLIKTLADLGSFSLASKLSNVFSLVSYSIYTVILTSNAKRRRDETGYNIKESLILGLFLIFLATAGSIISPYFFKLFFGNKFDESIIIFSILIFSQAFTSIHKFLDNYFFVEEKSHTLFFITSSKLVLFIILSILLTKNFGILGLAFADLIVSIITTIFTFSLIISTQRYKK